MTRLSKEHTDTLKKYKNMSNLNIDPDNHIENQENRPFMEYL